MMREKQFASVAGAAAVVLTVGLGLMPQAVLASEVADGLSSQETVAADSTPSDGDADQPAQDEEAIAGTPEETAAGAKDEASDSAADKNATEVDEADSSTKTDASTKDTGGKDVESTVSTNETVSDSQGSKTVIEEPKSKGPLDDGTYVIETDTNRDQVVDAANGGTSNGTNAQIWASNNTQAQRWELTYNEGGWYTIARAGTKGKQVLDVSGGSAQSGTNVQLWEANGTKAQRWYLEKSGADGYFLVVSALSNGKKKLVLDINAGGSTSGSNLQIWEANGTAAQRFAFLLPYSKAYEKVIEDGAYEISAVGGNSSYAVDIASGSAASGANSQLYAKNGTNAQRFYFSRDSQGYYTITSTGTGKVLDVSSAGVTQGTNVQQWASNGSDAQKWALRQNSDGTFSLISKGTGLALDVAWGNYSSGGNLWGWRDTGALSQRFKLKSVSMLSDGVYEIGSLSNAGMVLDIANGSSSNGGALQLFQSNGTLAQRFQLVSQEDGGYRIRTAASGGWLYGGTASGTRVTQQGSSTTQASKEDTWDFAWHGGFYSLVNRASGLALDLKNGGTANGTAAWLYAVNGTAAQHFLFRTAQLISNGYYAISNGGGNLTLNGGSFDNGADLFVSGWCDKPTQYFKIVSNGSRYEIRNAMTGKNVDVQNGATGVGSRIQQYESNGSPAQLWSAQIADGGGVWFIGAGSKLALGNLSGAVRLVDQSKNPARATWKLSSVDYSAHGGVAKYINWMVAIANDDSHGYDQEYRWGERGDYDCSSLVITALRQAGFSTGWATYTGNMRSALTSRGFVWITDFSQLRPGDILLNEKFHTAVFMGDGKLVHAAGNEFASATGGRPGDQTGREIYVRNYYWRPWDGFLRYVG